jgi:hypothetical protein
VSGATIFERLDGVNDVLAAVVGEFDGDLYTGRQAQRIVCAAADAERLVVTLKTLAMRRVDQTDAWKSDGARSPQSWLADKTATTLSDAYGTVEFGAQLEQLPASQDPDSETQLLELARTGSTTVLKHERAAVRQRRAGDDATAKIHARRSHRDWIDAAGAFRYQATMTVAMGAKFKEVLDGFTDQVFQDARRAGVRGPLRGLRRRRGRAERGTRAPASRSRREGLMRVSDRGDPRRDNLAPPARDRPHARRRAPQSARLSACRFFGSLPPCDLAGGRPRWR